MIFGGEARMKKKNKLSHLLEPSLRLYFIALVLFTVASAFFNIYLTIAEAAVVVSSTSTSAAPTTAASGRS